MPVHDETRRDSSIIKSTGKKITTEDVQAHEASLKMEVTIPALVAYLKELVPEKSSALDSKLEKYNEGKMRAEGAYTCMKMDVGVDAMKKAFEKLACVATPNATHSALDPPSLTHLCCHVCLDHRPGFDSMHVYPNLHPKPIVV